jgi:outer membrane protein assembly factor BamB
MGNRNVRSSFRIRFRDHSVGVTPMRERTGTNVLRFDPSRMRGILDMVVDGKPLYEHPGEDSIFCMMRDLLMAAERLCAGELNARVSFYESPFELVFQRMDNRLLLTFYRGGHSPEVILKDRNLALSSFLRGIAESADTLMQQMTGMDSTATEDPQFQWMQDASDRIRTFSGSVVGDGESKHAGAVTVRSSRWKEPRTKNGFSFGFRFVATATDLLAPGRPLGNDLNALLFRGCFAIHVRERRRVMGQGYLFLQMEKLLSALKKLLTAWEEGRPMSVRLISEGLSVGLRLTKDDLLSVTLSGGFSEEDSVVVLNDVSPFDFADAVLGVAREIRRHVTRLSPQQRRNMRLDSYAREVRQLTTWIRELQKDALINENIDPYRQYLQLTAQRETEEEIYRSKALSFKECWRLEAEGIDLRGTLLCGDMALVSARGAILGVDVATGSVQWSRETDRSECRLQMAGRDGFVRSSQSGLVEMLDLQTGAVRWRSHLSPRSGGEPVLMVIEQGALPGMVIVAEEDRHLMALDLRTGEVRFRYSVSRGGRFALRRHGKLLYVVSGDTHVSAVDLEDGEVVWRFPGRTRFMMPPFLEHQRLFQVGGRPNRPDGHLFALDALSGERLWSVPLKGSALMGPVVSNGAVLVPISVRGRNDLVAFAANDGEELWRIPCDGWAQSCVLLPLDDKFVVNVAGGTLYSFDAMTGRTDWCTTLGPVCSDDIPLSLSFCLRGGALFVPADTVYVVNPKNGKVIQSLASDPPVPDLMHVNPDCSVFVAEESGHIGMYRISRSFTLLNGGS